MEKDLLEKFEMAANSHDPKDLLRFGQDLKDYFRANKEAMKPWYERKALMLLSIGEAIGCLRAMGKDQIADHLVDALMEKC